MAEMVTTNEAGVRDDERVNHVGRAVKGTALLVTMALGSLSLWTVVPLGWLWLAANVDRDLDASFNYVIALLGAPVTMVALVGGLRWLERSYLAVLRGQPVGQLRRPRAWLRSTTDEQHPREGISVLEVLLGVSVIMALVAMIVMLIFEGAPIVPVGPPGGEDV